MGTTKVTGNLFDIDSLPEDTSPNVVADFLVSRDATDGSIKKVLMSNAGSGALPRSYLAGLGLNNNALDAANDIDVAIGEARNADNDGNLSLTSVFVKRIDASWAVGTNAGGLSSSLTITNDTWYHVHLILVAGVEDVGFDTSIVAANLITDHSATEFRRIGSVRRGTATNLAFSQVGDEFLWNASILDHNAISASVSAVSIAMSTPLGIQTIVLFSFGYDSGGNNLYLLTSLDQDDIDPSADAFTVAVNSSIIFGCEVQVRTNTSSQIRHRADAAGTFSLYTKGWIDRRGRDD